MCWVANPFAGSKTRGQTKEKELILWKKERKKAKNGKSMQNLAIWNNILTFLMPTCPLHRLSFNMSQQKPPHPLFTIFFHLLSALPQTLYYSNHATEQSDINTFSTKTELNSYSQMWKLSKNMEGKCQALFLAGKQTWLTESLAAEIAGSAGCCR